MKVSQKATVRQNLSETHRARKMPTRLSSEEKKEIFNMGTRAAETHGSSRERRCRRETFSMQECGKSFRVSSELVEHQRIHTEEKPLRCQQCGKRFRWSSDLSKHLAPHQRLKPYKCSWCGRSFSQNTNLHTHQRTHAGEKPFHVRNVGENSARTPPHTGEQPHTCDMCRRSFSRWPSLLRHQKLHQGRDACPVSSV